MKNKSEEIFNLWCSEHGKDEEDVRAMTFHPAGIVDYTQWLLDHLFNLSKELPELQSRYLIGVDLSPNDGAYCLLRISNNNVGPVITKRIADRKALEEEVSNISKYFNATIIREY